MNANLTPNRPSASTTVTTTSSMLQRSRDLIQRIVPGKSKSGTSLGPVSRLPTEILTKIIAHIPDVCDEKELPETSIRISHVCSLWRAIILSSPCKALWAVVPVYICMQELIEIFLSRAHPLPISLYFVRSRPTGRKQSSVDLDSIYQPVMTKAYVLDVYRAIMPHANLVKHMTIHGSWLTPAPELLPRALQGFSPTSIKLIRVSLADSVYLRWRHSLPDLRNLTLMRVSMFANSPFLTATLTSFGILKSQIGSSTEDLLAVLSQMHALEQLNLYLTRGYSDWKNEPSAGRGLRSIALPSLQHLHLRGHVEEVGAVFQYLTLPASARVQVDLEYNGLSMRSRAVATLCALCSAVSAHIAAANMSPFRSIALDFFDANFSLVARSDIATAPPLILEVLRPKDTTKPPLVRRPDGDHRVKDLALDALLAIDSFASVKRLAITRHPSATTFAAGAIIERRLRHVRELVLTDLDPGPLGGLIWHFLRNPLPRLVLIEARGCRIPDTVHFLPEAASAHAGCAPLKLKLSNCTIETDTLRHLRAAGIVVEDGIR